MDPDSDPDFLFDADADPNPTFHPDADPDPDRSFQIDSYSTVHFGLSSAT